MADATDYHVRVPHESPTPTLLELLGRGFPEASESQLRSALGSDDVTLDGDVVRRPGLVLRPGGHLRIQLEDLDAAAGSDASPDAREVTRGDGWVLVDKPAGMPGGPPDDDPTHPFRYLADQLGIDRDAMTPVWPLPRGVGGPWLLAMTPADARQLAGQFAAGDVKTTWRLLAPLVDPAQGSWKGSGGSELNYATVQRRNGLAEIQVTPDFSQQTPLGFDPVGTILQAAAAHGSPILGDRRRGGYVVDGPTRCRMSAIFGDRDDLQISISIEKDALDWWPDRRVAAPDTPDAPDESDDMSADETPLIDVTDDVMSAVQAGRAWIDRATGVDAMDHGELARLRSKDGDEPGLFAIIDRDGPPAARLWGTDPWEVHSFDEAVAMRLDEAIGDRRDLFAHLDDCDLFRIVHGEADGLPGLYIDRLGGVVRLTITTRAAQGIRERAVDHLETYDDKIMILTADRIPRRAFRTELVRPGGRYLDPSGITFAREHELKIPLVPDRLEFPGRCIGLRPGRHRLRQAPPTNCLQLAPPTDGTLAALAHTAATGDTEVTALVAGDHHRELAAAAWSANGADTDALKFVDASDNRAETLLRDHADDCDGLVLDTRNLDGPPTDWIDHLETWLDAPSTKHALVYRGPQPDTSYDPDEPRIPADNNDLTDRLQSISNTTTERLQPPRDIPDLSQLPEIAPVTISWLTTE